MRGLGDEYKSTEASNNTEFVKLPPGGYVCTIKEVTDHHEAEKPYLHVVYDIREGEYTDFYSDEWGQSNKWAHDNRHYYSQKALGMFKGFLKAVDESNGTNFEEQAVTGFDEQRLKGLAVGYIIGEEEYEGDDGLVKTRLRVRATRPAQAIRDGRFKQPELKKLEADAPDPSGKPLPISDDEFPF